MSNVSLLDCVVITGSSKGIGLGLAKAFLSLGWAVVISARNEEQIQQTIQQLTEQFESKNILGLCCDVTQKDQLQQLWNTAIQHFGRINVWINKLTKTTKHAKRHF